MNDVQLEALYSNLLKQYFPHKKYPLKAQFYITKSLRHTIELNSRQVIIRVAEPFRSVPEKILTSLGLILLAKLFRYKIDRKLNQSYRSYVEQNLSPLYKPKLRKPSSKYTAYGKVYDLDLIFDTLNSRYFNNKLDKPILGWSINKSYTRLGFYVSEKNLLVISRIFDSPKAPQEVVDFLVYHEMLHIHISVKKVNGRRRIHPPEFYRLEKMFPNYEKIQAWIKKKRKYL
jgi:predicted metal-dependent hydrolase